MPIVPTDELCRYCFEVKSIVNCQECNLPYCNECDDGVHKIERNSRHIRVQINRPPAKPNEDESKIIRIQALARGINARKLVTGKKKKNY